MVCQGLIFNMRSYRLYFTHPSCISWQGATLVCLMALRQLPCIVKGGWFTFLQDVCALVRPLSGRDSRCRFVLEKCPLTRSKIA